MRGYIRVRTPDDKPGDWTAEGDVVPGVPYTYVSGDVAVVLDWREASAHTAALLQALDDWQTFYGTVHDYGDDERGMTQLEHGHDEYMARIAVVEAARAVIGAVVEGEVAS